MAHIDSLLSAFDKETQAMRQSLIDRTLTDDILSLRAAFSSASEAHRKAAAIYLRCRSNSAASKKKFQAQSVAYSVFVIARAAYFERMGYWYPELTE